MNILSDYKFELNKHKIITLVQSYCQTPPYEELSKIYDNLLPLLKDLSKPLGMFKIGIKPEDLRLDELEGCKYVVYCAITIGQDSVDEVDSLFNEGKFFEAIMLDTMASTYLFNISSQLFRKIQENCHSINLGLTRKIAPGDGEIGLEYQKDIIHELQGEDDENIFVVNGCMLYPSKSMSYIYGADENLVLNQQKDHCCKTCFNTFCNMKDFSMAKKIDCA